MWKFPQSSFDFQTKLTLVQVGPTVNQASKLCAFNPNRVFLGLQDSAGSIFFGPAGVTSTTGWMFQLFSQGSFQAMPYEWFGPWVQAEWWGVRGSGQSNVAVSEVIYNPHPVADIMTPAEDQ